MIARLIALAGLAAAAALAGAVVSLAGHESGSVPSYTGCLNASSGTIANLAQADTPTAPCKDKETQIHLSGGDVTSLTAGAGLTGGGSEGALTLAVDANSILTGLSPGFGLTGGGSGGDVSLAVDPSVIQRRVTGTCAEGGISAISESGAVSCSEQGVAGVLDAGRLDAEGSSDTSLCGTQDGDVEFDASSEPVSLPHGTYLPVPADTDGFNSLIRKRAGLGPDPDDAYRGRAWGLIKDEVGNVVSKFIRDYSSAGQNNNLDQDFNVFTTAGEVHLEIFAGADACTFVSVGGPVALLRVG